MAVQSEPAQPRPLHEIARDIRRNWPKPYFGAVPYLDAMATLTSIEDRYFNDSARDIVLYGLANMNTFRGDAARRLKAELKQLAGIK